MLAGLLVSLAIGHLRQRANSERDARTRTERQLRQTDRLQRLTAMLSRARTPFEAICSCLPELLHAVDAAAGAAYLVSDDGSECELWHVVGFAARPASSSHPLPASLAGAIRRRELVIAESPPAQDGDQFLHQGDVVVPLVDDGPAIGAVALRIQPAHTVTDDECEFLLSAGRHTAQALVRAKLYETAERARGEAEALRVQAAAELRESQKAEEALRVSVYAAPATQITQVHLRLTYQDRVRSGIGLPEFSDVEFRCYSQNGEDGVLLYIFSLLGTTNRRVVEICAGDGIECNAANLIINHGWQGLLLDGDADQIARGRAFYSTCRTTWPSPPALVDAWLTAENVDALVADKGFGGPIDLLSIDVDGNDYWIWKALQCVRPRVVVLEFNAACGPERSVTMSYQPDFRLDLAKPPYRCGASLPAFVKLAREKGYRLVGVQRLGFNAFFVRDGLEEKLLPERSARECYERTPRLSDWAPGSLDIILGGEQRWEDV
jgi:GAF domain-containing protein